MPSTCSLLKTQYASIKTLKAEFDLALETATTGATTPEQAKQALERAKVLKALLEQKRDALFEMLWPFTREGLSQKELKEQYEEKKDILQRVGLLETLSNGEIGIRGIDNKEYRYPALSAIAKEMRLNKETLKTKIEQGFVEVQITPIAQSLDKKIDVYRQVLWKHYKERKLFATMKNPKDTPQFPDDLPFNTDTINKIKSGAMAYEDVWKQGGTYQENGDVYDDKNKALWVWDKYKDADINGDLVYYPEKFEQQNHGGKTKLQLIEETKTTAFPGYIVILRENLPNIPRATTDPIEIAKRTKGGRRQLEAGETPNDYLNHRLGKLWKDTATGELSDYRHEIGMTLDDQIIQAMLYLEKHNQVMDDYSGNGSASYQLGAYFSADGFVPYAYWYRGFRRAFLGRYDPGYSASDDGVRAAVRVKKL